MEHTAFLRMREFCERRRKSLRPTAWCGEQETVEARLRNRRTVRESRQQCLQCRMPLTRADQIRQTEQDQCLSIAPRNRDRFDPEILAFRHRGAPAARLCAEAHALMPILDGIKLRCPERSKSAQKTKAEAVVLLSRTEFATKCREAFLSCMREEEIFEQLTPCSIPHVQCLL